VVRRLLCRAGVTTNLSPSFQSQLHERLARSALPGLPRLTGRSVANLALELAKSLPLAHALTQAIQKLGDSAEAAQSERLCATAMKLIFEGVRIDDAVTIALHEPAPPKSTQPLPEALRRRLAPKDLTGKQIVNYARRLNACGMKMDDALTEGLRRLSAQTLSDAQVDGVLKAAQELFHESHSPVEAFDQALRRVLPRHD
jgi:hypothetical protein